MKSIAENVVDAIIDDLNDRSGLGLDSVDEGVRAEIRETWVKLVEKTMQRCPHCERQTLGTALCRTCDNDD